MEKTQLCFSSYTFNCASQGCFSFQFYKYISTFFIDNIGKIRSGFPSLLSPHTSHENVRFFSKFRGVSTDDVRKIILGSPTKSCSLNPWPTFLVRVYIDILIQPITSIVNLSLSERVVIDKFKCAVVILH